MTNQEKMQKIYEATGIEPRMWESTGEIRLISKDHTNVCLKTYYKDEQIYEWVPHYPCEQLWEMLPDTVIGDGGDKEATPSEWRLVIERDHEAGVKYIQEAYGNTYDLIVMDIGKDRNLHTALLDMVLWCIEEGYIK